MMMIAVMMIIASYTNDDYCHHDDDHIVHNDFFVLRLFVCLGKRKYPRGRITGRRQMWVLGGVCRFDI